MVDVAMGSPEEECVGKLAKPCASF